VRVTVGADDLHHVVAHLEDGDVEGAAAEVVDRDDVVLLLVEAVGERRRRGLVDDALDVETGDAARVLGGLALRVVEVRGDRDDGLGDRSRRGSSRRPSSACGARARHLGGSQLLAADLEAHVAVARRTTL
jgi:hypothetical protein